MHSALQFSKHSGIYTLEVEQVLNVSLEEAWSFFSNPKNLSKITPLEMGFEITSKPNNKMYPGEIITYKVGILPGIKTNWVTEITQINYKKFFIDEQRFGPYALWHHEHHFEELAGQVKMRDKISYKLPFSFFSNFFHDAIIKPQLKKIFAHRYEVLSELF